MRRWSLFVLVAACEHTSPTISRPAAEQDRPAAVPPAPVGVVFGPPRETVSLMLLDTHVELAIPHGSQLSRMSDEPAPDATYVYRDDTTTIRVQLLRATDFDAASIARLKQRARPLLGAPGKKVEESDLADGWIVTMRADPHGVFVDRLIVHGRDGIDCRATVERRDMQPPEDEWLAVARELCMGVRAFGP